MLRVNLLPHKPLLRRKRLCGSGTSASGRPGWCRDGYVPDMVGVQKDIDAEKRAEDVLHLHPRDLALVVEVTSSSNARHDRRPMFGRQVKPTKWSGYARTGVPYYLLVDRDPRQPGVTLFGEPNKAEGTYESLGEWKFGESVRLPEPFEVEIVTDAWKPWSS
ncbi:Uma2 family endonuclease [Kitasatospora sp. NPDC058162]|uniref:Uma2 family endonuclease n=1 Tax=Kitasatospora sp. NPDC058162 TaxID=3346362 RepID=UPI0036DB899F